MFVVSNRLKDRPKSKMVYKDPIQKESGSVDPVKAVIVGL